jgi:hypothetical protein
MTDDPLLSVREASVLLSRMTGRFVSVKRVRSAIRAGRLPFFADPATGRLCARRSAIEATYRRVEDAAVAAVAAAQDAPAPPPPDVPRGDPAGIVIHLRPPAPPRPDDIPGVPPLRRRRTP